MNHNWVTLLVYGTTRGRSAALRDTVFAFRALTYASHAHWSLPSHTTAVGVIGFIELPRKKKSMFFCPNPKIKCKNKPEDVNSQYSYLLLPNVKKKKKKNV